MTLKREARIGREKLRRIIETCKSVEERSLDPFSVNVKDVVNTLKRYFPIWERYDDLCLDAEAVHGLASIVKLQGEWVKRRSTSLYIDPFLLEEKVMRMGKGDIVEVFLKAWRPIIGLERVSAYSLAEAIKYWRGLPPLKERWAKLNLAEAEASITTHEELRERGIMRDRTFLEELKSFWLELRERAVKSVNGKVPYWDFVGAETYGETVHRALMLSFLVTYGYATLEVRPLEEETFIIPYEKPVKVSRRQTVSVPIAITVDSWRTWRSRLNG